MLRPLMGLPGAALLAAALLAAVPTAPILADEGHDHGHAAGGPEVLGKVHFAVTCAPSAQQAFDRAIALEHSFWYQAAHQAFSAVLESDPQCVMAYWGIAMALLNNPFGGAPAKNLADGAAALAKAKAIGAKSPREADYIAALTVFYTDTDTRDHRARVVAYAQAMADVAARHPDDSEAQIFYALALDTSASPTDKGYANQLKAASILEAAFAAQPDHPGVAHYLIHTYDNPVLAQKGLPAALRYAEIAPSAPHALHMPSHIFTRVGYWQQSIDTNRRSAVAAQAAGEISDQMHAYDYMAYAQLQMAEDHATRRVIDEAAAALAKAPPDKIGGAAHFSAAAMPARYALERGAWAEAAALQRPPSGNPFFDAITPFARGIGAARSGKVAAAQADLAVLRGLEDKQKSNNAYLSDLIGIQGDVLAAWIARAEGKPDAVALLRAAAEREGKTEKPPITPGPLAPAREMLGEMLLESGQAAPALVEFEASQRTEPNRFRSVFGAARAAELTHDRDRAKLYYGRLLELCRQTDSDRAELGLAKVYLSH
jgi:hypothetical protein